MITHRIVSDKYSNHNLPIGAEVTQLNTSDAPDWSDDGVEWYTQGGEGDQVAIDSRDLSAAGCSCARNLDGSTTKMLCPVHADIDPCLATSRVTGRRRKGTIRRGICTNCGWRKR